METDASDYVIAGILSICCPDEEIRPVTYYSWTLSTLELNYDIHDKELLATHKAFRFWHHYLEVSATLINIITNHKNLEYFATTKLLTQWQVCWSEFLSQFNLVIYFHPGCLGAKPDALTRHWDVYPKERDKNYAYINLHNFCPVFVQEQPTSSLQPIYLTTPVL